MPWRVVAKDRGAPWHSMAGVYHHVLLVYDKWLNYVVQGERAEESMVKRWEALESMAEIAAFREDVWRGVDRLLKGLTPARLQRKVKAPWQPKACSLADAFAQVATTTVSLRKETKETLRRLGVKGQTYDEIIRQLIDRASVGALDARWNRILEEAEFIPLDEL